MFTGLILLIQNCKEGADSPAGSTIDALAGIDHMDQIPLSLDGMGRAHLDTGGASLA